MVERRHNTIGIELEIIGLELIAGEEIEPYLVEGERLWRSTRSGPAGCRSIAARYRA
jgi:hypothetical protein